MCDSASMKNCDFDGFVTWKVAERLAVVLPLCVSSLVPGQGSVTYTMNPNPIFQGVNFGDVGGGAEG